MAQIESERKALDKRHRAAVADAATRGAEGAIRDFEVATQASKAVIARRLGDAVRLSSSDKELYSTYYKLLEADVRLPFGDDWDRLRRLADTALFPGYEKEIRFAALSLDEVGLAEYGDCFLILREDMIAHRATAFEENSAAFLRERHDRIPEGSRASWAERSKLCTAKNAGDLRPGMSDSDFAPILLRQKMATEESRFVEVHIYGPMSIHSVEKVILKKDVRLSKKSFGLELRDRLAKAGLPLEVK